MRFNPYSEDEDEKELLGTVTGSQEQPVAMNPMLRAHLMKKIQQPAPEDQALMDALSAPAEAKPTEPTYLEELKEAQARSADRQSSLGAWQIAAGLGDAIAGRSAAGTAQTFDKMRSGIDVQEVGGLEQRRKASDLGKADDKLRREQDPKSTESILAQTLAKKMLPAMDFTGKSAQELNDKLPMLGKIYDAEQKRLDRTEAREERRFQSGIRNDERQDVRNEKRADKELALAVPGYKRTGEVLPKVEEAASLRKATANASQLVKKLDRLKTLVGEKGSYENGGTGGTEMESLATEIQLLSKGEDMYHLGVLSGPDMKLLEKITSDPGGISSMFTRDSTRQKQLDTQLKSIKEKLAAVTKASGYEPENAPTTEDEAPKATDEAARASARQKRIAELKAKQGSR